MGLMRKLAELVVEFPDEAGQQAQSTAADDNDVVAQIEKIRLNLERGSTTDFPADEEPAESAPAAAPSETAQSSPVIAKPDESVTLPRVLGVDEIYKTAKLAGEDSTIYKVEKMLNDPEISDLDMKMRARMVKLTLKNMGIELNDILTDAGLRDRVLGEYQSFLAKRIAEVAANSAKIKAEIQAEIDAYITARTAVVETNEYKLEKLKDRQAEFLRSKQMEEQRLFNIAMPLVEEGQNPVVIDDTDK